MLLATRCQIDAQHCQTLPTGWFCGAQPD